MWVEPKRAIHVEMIDDHGPPEPRSNPFVPNAPPVVLMSASQALTARHRHPRLLQGVRTYSGRAPDPLKRLCKLLGKYVRGK